MALNFTVSYTFAPSTTIASAQVNTNTSDVANVFTGLEAKTKSFAFLKVDATPTSSTEVTIKSYVDSLMAYRRPVLQYSSGTVVNIETGINGTSGQAQILFPDGNLRTDSTSSRINCNLAQVAALSGTAQSGLRTGSVANNTYYAVYAVKVSDNSSNFVTVADTVFPIQSNYATLNSNFGTSSWIFLGYVAYGDNANVLNAIVKFVQVGPYTILRNANAGNADTGRGIRLATTGGATSITWSFANGSAIGSAQIPNTITALTIQGLANGASADTFKIEDSGGTFVLASYTTRGSSVSASTTLNCAAADGLKQISVASSSQLQDLTLCGWYDAVLGVGSNPIL